MGQICEISDGLYLSGARAIKMTKLREIGISAIFNVTVELPNLPIDNVSILQIYFTISFYCLQFDDKKEVIDEAADSYALNPRVCYAVTANRRCRD